MLSVSRKIALHTLWQVAGKVLGTFLGLLTIGVVTRYLGPEGFGRYTTVIAYLQLFGILVDFGLYMVLIKRISDPEANEEQLVNNIFTLRLISAVIFLGIAPIITLFIPSYPPIVRMGIALTSFSFLFITLIQLLTTVFQKHIATGKIAVAELIGRVVLLGATILFIVQGQNLLYLLLAVVLGSAINFAMVFAFVQTYVRLRLRFDWSVWKEVMWEAWPIALSISLNLIYFKADTFILSLFRPASEVGIYGAPYKVLEVLITFPTMFVGLVLPLLAKEYLSRHEDRFRSMLQQSFEVLAMFAVPLIAGGMVLAEPIMLLVGGEAFRASAPVLRLLIWPVGIIFCGTLFGHLIVVIQKQRQMLWGYLFVAVTSLLAYLILVPFYSYYGAAAVTIYSEFMVSSLVIFLVLKTTGVRFSMRPFFKIILSALGMAGALLLVPDAPLLLRMTMGVGAYAILLMLLGVISKQRLLLIFKPS